MTDKDPNGQQQKTGRIDDPEDQSQNKRINSLLNRRDVVLEARDVAKDEYHLGEATKEQAIRHYQSRLETLIVDLWTKFKNDLIEDGEKYLKSKEIATVEIPPPPGLVPSNEDLAAGVTPPEPKEEKIKGLLWFKNNDPVIQRSFTTHTWNPPGEKTMPNRVVLDFRILDEAVATCFEFMDKAGIDADIEEDDTPIIRGFDHSGDKSDGELDGGKFTGDPEI